MEVFSLLCHGSVESAEVLDNRTRSNIPIISMGTEGFLTYMTPTYTYIHYLIHKHGKPFMQRLLSILLEMGLSYPQYKPRDESDMEKDLVHLFRVNKRDISKFPSNILRAYYGNDTILNLTLSTNLPDETVMATEKMSQGGLFNREKESIMCVSLPDMEYKFNTSNFNPNLTPGSVYMNLVQPMGLARFQGDTFHMIDRATMEGDDLQYYTSSIREMVGKSKVILFLTCCKKYDTDVMMDLSPDGIEKPVNQVSLVRMMQRLKLTSTPLPSATKKTIKLIKPTKSKPRIKRTRVPTK